MRPESEPPRNPSLLESHASYDPQGLDGVCNGNEPLRRRILAEFARTAPDQVDQLLEGLAGGKGDMVRQIAHTLKGSSRTVGAFALGTLCEHLELGGADSAFERISIREEFERVRRAVDSHLESLE